MKFDKATKELLTIGEAEGSGMITPVVYMAHLVAPKEGETIEGNLAAAKAWLKRLAERHPHLCFIAPWITECEIWDDSDPKQRAAGLARCHIVIRKCDHFWMVGPRVSSGMQGESEVAMAHGLFVANFTGWELKA